MRLTASQRIATLKRALGLTTAGDYRAYLFAELSARLRGRVCPRILEVGPKDGKDTRRLLTLQPDHLVLVDQPGRERVSVAGSGRAIVTYVEVDVVTYQPPMRFDLIWCTGVLYHVKEQYRLLRQFHEWLTPGGVLVLESATTRRQNLRALNVVEILYPPSADVKKKYHLSFNITHLPSSRAIQSWLEMAGFTNITRSSCHRRVSRELDLARAAFLAEKL